MKKLMCILLMFCLYGCAQKQESTSSEKIIETLQVYLPEDTEEQDPEVIRRMLDIDKASIREIRAFAGKSENEQLLYVVEAETERDALAAAERLEYYVNSLKNSAKMYRPEQLELIGKAFVIVHENYAVLVICENIDEARKTIAEMIG